MVIYCVFSGSPPQIQMWRDCADVYKAGHSVSGLYHIYISNSSEPVQVRSTPERRRCLSPTLSSSSYTEQNTKEKNVTLNYFL